MKRKIIPSVIIMVKIEKKNKKKYKEKKNKHKKKRRRRRRRRRNDDSADDDSDNGGPTTQRPNKIIDFTLSGTGISLLSAIIPFASLVNPLNNSQCVTFVGSHEYATTFAALHEMAVSAYASYVKNLVHTVDLCWLLKR